MSRVSSPRPAGTSTSCSSNRCGRSGAQKMPACISPPLPPRFAETMRPARFERVTPACTSSCNVAPRCIPEKAGVPRVYAVCGGCAGASPPQHIGFVGDENLVQKWAGSFSKAGYVPRKLHASQLGHRGLHANGSRFVMLVCSCHSTLRPEQWQKPFWPQAMNPESPTTRVHVRGLTSPTKRSSVLFGQALAPNSLLVGIFNHCSK